MTAMPQPTAPKPSLERLDQLIRTHSYDTALEELLRILDLIQMNLGGLDGIDWYCPPQLTGTLAAGEYFCTRLAGLITILFTDREFILSDANAIRLFGLHKSIALVFAVSGYLNSDHILRTFDVTEDEHKRPNVVALPLDPSTILKFSTLYTAECSVDLALDMLWNFNANLCACLCLALQSPRINATPASYTNRHRILKWLPEKLFQLRDVESLPVAVLHDVYMHCSYDTDRDKHEVKKGLNDIIRRQIVKNGWQDRDTSTIGTVGGKPVMLVALEWFSGGHSIYRTHSTSLLAAKEHFHLIGVGTGNTVDDTGAAVFDEFHRLDLNRPLLDHLQDLRRLAEHYRPAVYYIPSLGMQLYTIYSSVTRLAPIQAFALGHPATSHSECMDYVIVEDDYVGSEACFSESLIRLPKDALPYVPSRLKQRQVQYHLRQRKPDIVRIGVATSIMKLNPVFLGACRKILDTARVRVHFHFATSMSVGIMHNHVTRVLHDYLGDAVTVHAQQPYDQYLETLARCDMLINPFPFGNTNGIVDMVTVGLVGVCKTGDEVHEHIDEGLFRRLGLPEWLIAHSEEEYVRNAVRLAENHEERLAMRRDIIEHNKLAALFSGNPRPLGQRLIAKVRELGLTETPITPGFELPAPMGDAHR